MRKPKFLLAALAVSMLAIGTPAGAATVCFQLTPFIDILEIDAEVGTSGKVDLWGKWVVCDGYNFPLVGEAHKGTEPGTFRFGIHATTNNGAMRAWPNPPSTSCSTPPSPAA